MGFLHKDSSRRPALVMDLMEEFRVPIVDKPFFTYVFRNPVKPLRWLGEHNRLNDNAKKLLMDLFFKRVEETVTFLNRTYKMKFHIQLQCRRMIKFLMGYAGEYTPFKLTK
jgi:CRISPR-associated protein Cas1